MRRRLHIVPFSVTIPLKERDPNLVEKLAAERDGILGWMIEGCAEWQHRGLAPPDAIRNATNDYFGEEDVIGQWIADNCTVGVNLRARSSDLFRSWSDFAGREGLEKGSQKSLGSALRARGFSAERTQCERLWRGIAVTGSREARQ